MMPPSNESYQRAARENLESARTLEQRKKFRGAINRMYYAAFQALRGRLMKSRQEAMDYGEANWTWSHGQVLQWLDRHGAEDDVRGLRRLKTTRTQADYLVALPLPNRDEIRTDLKEATRLVDVFLTMIFTP